MLIRLEHGQPVKFGAEAQHGIRRNPANGSLEICAGDDSGVLIHDANADDPTQAFALSRVADPGTLARSPIGIFRQVDKPAYGDLMSQQISDAVAKQGGGDLAALLRGDDTWSVG